MNSAALKQFPDGSSSSISADYKGWRRVSRRNPCPICQHADFCEVSQDGQTAHCMRVSSDRPTSYRQGGWFHSLGAKIGATVADLRPIKEAKKVELAPIEVRHEAISQLLSRLGLSEAHREYLENEGFAPEQALELGYRTLPREGRAGLAREIVGLVGPEAARGLAFLYEKKGRAGSSYFQFAATRDELLLIPVRDIAGRLAGLKGRWTSLNEKTGLSLRHYRVLSAGSLGGASLGTPLHIARPEARDQKLEIRDQVSEARFFAAAQNDKGLEVIPPPSSFPPQSSVLITEGEKKADYIAWATGMVCVGVQGTGNWRAGGGIGHLISTLTALEAKQVEIAFDADLEQNKRVARDLYQMGCQLQAAGFEVWVRRWPLEAAKGYDDLLRAGLDRLEWLEPFSPLEGESAGKRLIELEPEAITARRFKGPNRGIRSLLSVAEAREQHAKLFRQTFSEHFFSLGQRRQSLIVTSNPGTGKTYAALAEALATVQSYPQGRILYLADNKEVYRQWLQPGALLYQAAQSGWVAVREGRQSEAGQFECRKKAECQAAGQQRHAPSWDVCASCPFASLQNWRAYLAATGQSADIPMLWDCGKEGYWNGVEKANKARLVLAPKASFLNNSQELAEFDIIIVDESVLEHLLEQIVVTRETLAVWREGIQRQDYDEDAPFMALFELVERALALHAEQLSGEKAGGRQRLWSARALLQEAAKRQKVDLAGLIAQCRAVPAGSQTGRYGWERPFTQPNGRLSFPLHFARELVEALGQECSTEQADTRLWLDVEGNLKVFLPRQHLLDILQGREGVSYKNQLGQPPTVVLLDATPPPLMLDYVLGASSQMVNFEVVEHIEVTQLTNSLYTKDELKAREGRGLTEVSRVLTQEISRYKSAAVFSHKAFNPAIGEGPLKLGADTPNTQVTWGHFDRDNKALNSLSEVELIAVVGHYCHPLDILKAQVEAFRFGRANEKPGLGIRKQAELWKLRAYGWQNEQGRGLARRCRADHDQDVQAAIEHCERAAIIQAIGRGRPTLRSADQPLRVLLVTATPLEEWLPVNRLVTAKELLGENNMSLAQAETLARGRAVLLAKNQSRQAEAIQRLQAALQTPEVTPAKVYLNPTELGRLVRVKPWQPLELVVDQCPPYKVSGFDKMVSLKMSSLKIGQMVYKYLRLHTRNQPLFTLDWFIYSYKPVQYENPLVSTSGKRLIAGKSLFRRRLRVRQTTLKGKDKRRRKAECRMQSAE